MRFGLAISRLGRLARDKAVEKDGDPKAKRPRLGIGAKGGGPKPFDMGPKPVKLCGELWEEPREKTGLQLVGDLAAKVASWTYIVKDEPRRSFAAHLPKALSEEDSKAFFETIRDETPWGQPMGRRGPIPRKTAWMVKSGCTCSYRYGGIEVQPTVYPPWMSKLLHKLMPTCGFPSEAAWPDSCNLNLYMDGAMSVGWHSDDESLFQGKFRDIVIISLSLGVSRQFQLRLNWPEESDRILNQIKLGEGDLMTMEGMTQKHFQHRVPKEENIDGPRINLTWRWVHKHSPQCPVGRMRQPEPATSTTQATEAMAPPCFAKAAALAAVPATAVAPCYAKAAPPFAVLAAAAVPCFAKAAPVSEVPLTGV